MLMRDGEAIPLQPKAFDLLHVLVQHHGHLLEKDELLKVVWPDTIVEEVNLANNISVLRKALGEDGNGQRFIETVPRRGYRFVAKVSQIQSAPVEEKPPIATLAAEPLSPRMPPAAAERSGQWRRLALALTGSGTIIIAIVAWFYFNRSPVLTSQDLILLADFENRTGDEIFDGTLKQGLAIQLRQSPFLNLFPEPMVRQTLLEMKRPPDARVTAEAAREICERHNLKALITGSIASLGSHYVITLEAISGQSGESLAHEQVEAESREQVLQALSRAAMQLRGKLGESLGSIQQFDKPLKQATTSKLEAFKALSLGFDRSYSGDVMEAIRFYKRAVEIDPDFALAYNVLSVTHGATGRPGLAAEYAEKAYKLRDHVSEFEKLHTTNYYYAYAIGDLNKRIEVLMLFRGIYARNPGAPTDLAVTYNMIGQYDQAIAHAREAIRLNPNFAPAYRALGLALLPLNRFAEARDALTQALQQNLDTPDFHAILYQIAFTEGDTALMRQQIDWARGRPNEYIAFDWQTGAAAFAGQWRKAQDFSRLAIDLAAPGDTQEVAARYATEQALRGAVFRDCRQASADAVKGLALARGRASLPRAALAFALCGQASQAKTLTDEISRRYPEDTVIHSLWLPAIIAAIDLHRGDATRAIEQLQATSRYEAAAEFWPHYLRGQAYLRQQAGAEAAAAFQQIVEHRGWRPDALLYPLAHLGLARAAALAGDAAKSRQAYQDFFALWQGADPDLPILRAARQEYDRLQP
jgi:eukaryotic-like serine/threonine-protein kinase